MKISHRLLVLAFALVFASAPLAANAAGFTVTSNGLADNAMMPDEMRGSAPDANKVSCGGTDKAPGVSWANPPAKTESYAILEVDPDGRAGLGVNHWVLYNIPVSATGINTADVAAGKYTQGKPPATRSAIARRVRRSAWARTTTSSRSLRSTHRPRYRPASITMAS